MPINATLNLKITNPDDPEDYIEFEATESRDDIDALGDRLPRFFMEFEKGCYQAMLKLAEDADNQEGS